MTWIEWIRRWLRRQKPSVPSPPSPPSRTLLEAINAYRARQGRPAFVGDACLDQQATTHAIDVWNGLAKPHDGFMRRLSICGKGTGAENWAEASTPDEAVAMWADSPGHRANMLASYTYCGSAIAENSAVMICGNSSMREIVLGKPAVDCSNERMTCASVS